MRLIDRVFVINIFLSFFSILYAQPQQQDFWLEMDDGVKLDVTYFIPAGMVPVGGFPCIVFVHGLGGSKSETAFRGDLLRRFLVSDTLRILGIPTAYLRARGTASRFQINLQLNDHATRILEGETCSISLFPDEVYLTQNYPNPFNSATATNGGMHK